MRRSALVAVLVGGIFAAALAQGADAASTSPVGQSGGVLLTSGNRLEISSCGLVGGRAWLVDPASLKLRSTGCGPMPFGERVATYTVALAAKSAVDDCRPESAGVRAVRLTPAGWSEALRTVVLRYAGNCSTTRPITTYAGDAMWLYDCATGPSGRGGEAVQLDGTTGAVEDTVQMAADCYTSFGADADGAFVGSYDNGGPVYFAAAGTHRAVAVLHTAGRTNWLYGAGSSLYANIGRAGGSCAPVSCGIWRFEGSHAAPHLVVADPNADALVATPVGDGSTGLYSAELTGPSSSSSVGTGVEIVHIDTETGRVARVATIPLGAVYGGPPSLAYLDGSLFVLFQGELYRY